MKRNTGGGGFSLNSDPCWVLSILNNENWYLIQARSLQTLMQVKRHEQRHQDGGHWRPDATCQLHADRKNCERVARDGQTLVRKLAEEWIASGKNLDKAPNVVAEVKAFLMKHHLFLLRSLSSSALLSFQLNPLKATPKQKIAVECGVLLLTLVVSRWSKDFYCCARCGKYFVKPRATSPEPRCSRTCRNRETSKKQRQRNRDYARKMDAFRAASAWLDRQPARKLKETERRRVLTEKAMKDLDAVWAKRGKELPRRMRVTVSFYTRHENEIVNHIARV